jgi:hypothetical protein
MFGRRSAREVTTVPVGFEKGKTESATEPYPFVFFDPEHPHERFGFSRYDGMVEKIERSLSAYYAADDEDDEDYLADQVVFEMKHRKVLRKTREYLVSTRAVQTPLEVYALWIDLHVQQGGEVDLYDRNFAGMDSAWMPTRFEGVRTPVAHGSSSLHILLIPDTGEQDLMTLGNYDRGHSEVHWFDKGDSKIPVARTNAYHAQTYTDVENLRRSISSKELATRALDIMAQARAL